MQRTFLLGLGIALGTVLAASGVQASSISLDDLRKGDTFVSGNGKLEFSDFDLEAMRERVLRLNPDIRIFEISAKTGQGVEEWAAWLSGEATGFIRG